MMMSRSLAPARTMRAFTSTATGRALTRARASSSFVTTTTPLAARRVNVVRAHDSERRGAHLPRRPVLIGGLA